MDIIIHRVHQKIETRHRRGVKFLILLTSVLLIGHKRFKHPAAYVDRVVEHRLVMVHLLIGQGFAIGFQVVVGGYHMLLLTIDENGFDKLSGCLVALTLGHGRREVIVAELKMTVAPTAINTGESR